MKFLLFDFIFLVVYFLVFVIVNEVFVVNIIEGLMKEKFMNKVDIKILVCIFFEEYFVLIGVFVIYFYRFNLSF